jgi:hypothetical protein
MDSERMGRRNHHARSLTPTTRAEENARSVDGVRDDEFVFRESFWFTQPFRQAWLGLLQSSHWVCRM